MEAVIFDIDGTLIDSVDVHAQAWREAFLHFGKDIPHPKLRASVGKGGDQFLPDFLSKDEIEEFGEEMEKWRGEHFKKTYMKSLRPFTLVRELGQRLREDGKRLALATSAKGDELDYYKGLIGFEDLLDAETSSDDAEKSKPHPDIFLAALDRLGKPDPQKVLVVGDTPYDIEAASKAGMRTVAVLCGGFPKDSLIGAIAVFQSPSELLFRYEDTPFS
ncbi:HAD family hydrolase [bacterium]|nr:MAG: HAD family hydrolase [bacterium]